MTRTRFALILAVAALIGLAPACNQNDPAPNGGETADLGDSEQCDADQLMMFALGHKDEILLERAQIGGFIDTDFGSGETITLGQLLGATVFRVAPVAGQTQSMRATVKFLEEGFLELRISIGIVDTTVPEDEEGGFGMIVTISLRETDGNGGVDLASPNATIDFTG